VKLPRTNVQVLQLAALKGVFSDVVEEQVTFVNAPLLAKDRGIDVGLATLRKARITGMSLR